MNTKTLVLTVASLVVVSARAQIWINEFHYKNNGADVGEFVEIAAPSGLTAGQLASIQLTLYNGNGGAPYSASGGSTHLLSSFSPGATVNGFTLYSKSIVLQNGAPDGFALDQSGSVLQFLSYEGSFTAVGGAANDHISTDVGVQEFDSATTPAGSSLGLTGFGSGYDDFTWAVIGNDTPGALNDGQTILAPIPEPHEYALVAGFGLLCFALGRRYLCRQANLTV